MNFFKSNDDHPLEEYRNKLPSNEQLIQLIKEICLFDSVHDFTSNKESIFYDTLIKKRFTESYSLLTNINFTIVCNKIFPIIDNNNGFSPSV